MVLNTIVDMMHTYGIEYYRRHDVHKVRCDGKEEEEEKINKVNTMTTIETISWSKNIPRFYTLQYGVGGGI